MGSAQQTDVALWMASQMISALIRRESVSQNCVQMVGDLIRRRRADEMRQLIKRIQFATFGGESVTTFRHIQQEYKPTYINGGGPETLWWWDEPSRSCCHR